MAFRRGNKSSKVPNVKLRPAAPVVKVSRSKDHEAAPLHRRRDSDFDSEYETSFADVVPRPLRGVVLCATGINDKTSVFKQAIELGGESLNDLTDKVTHLLATKPGSDKYKCALELNIPIMHPSWITECYQIWLRGDDVDLEESIRNHRLPIFDGVVLSVSGIEDVTKRTEINRLVTREGGVYVKNIERPVKVTHLLCSSGIEEMTEKMKYAEKFNKRGEASIRMLWDDWFWDSLKAKGRCDENDYDVYNPRPIVNPTPEPASPPPRSPSPALPELQEPTTPNTSKGHVDELPDNEEDEEEIASVKRVPSVTLQIWESMLKPRGFEVQAGKLIRSSSKARGSSISKKDDFPPDSPTKLKTPTLQNRNTDTNDNSTYTQNSVLTSFRRTASFVPQAKSTQRQPFKRVTTVNVTTASSVIYQQPPGEVFAQGGDDFPVASGSDSLPKVFESATSSNTAVIEAGASKSGLFAGKTFRVLGEARGPSVRQALEQAGGKLASDDADENVDFILVRLVSGSKFYRNEPEERERVKYRTECWLEKCLFEERICGLDDHISFTPLRVETPLSGAEFISLSFSGLDQSETCWVQRLARALGMSLAPNFSRRTTHLLCPSGNGAKFDKALEWGIPAVDMNWLADVCATGQIPLPTGNTSYASHLSSGDEIRAVVGKGRSYPIGKEQKNKDNDGNDDQPVDTVGDESPENVTFGPPTGLLGICADQELPLERTRTLSSKSDSVERGDLSSSVVSYAEAHGGVHLEEMRAMTIPSSVTPSPMKPPDATLPTSSGSRESAKTLQDSITSLLGKRPSEEDTSSNNQARPKRARPPARITTAQTRHTTPPTVSTTGSEKLIGQTFDPFAPSETGDPGMQREQPSMRVTYEDPEQHDERLRLMKLLESQKQGLQNADDDSQPIAGTSKGKRRTGTRRSSRVAGF